MINDFSHLVANEVEVETCIETNQSKQRVSHKASSFFESSDYSNGALFEHLNYCWSQNFAEIDIHVRLPSNVTSKHLKVNISNTSLEIFCNLNGQRLDILSGQLCEKCKAADAIWTITGGSKLNITIEKTKEVWWKKLLQHETDIDLSKLDCSRPMEELSEETQAHINQIQFDEQQKLKGQLTSEQIQQEDMLRKAWNAEGSPFKCQPFDPSILHS